MTKLRSEVLDEGQAEEAAGHALAYTDVATPFITALAHPLRLRILAALRDRALTVRELASELAAPSRQVVYHARKMERLGFLAFTDGPEVAERQLKLAALPHLTDEAWGETTVATKHAYATALVNQFHAIALAAVPAGGFDRPNMHLTRTPFVVDEGTWDALATELAATLQRVEDLEREGRRRVAEEGARAVHGSVQMLLFETPLRVARHATDERDPDPHFAEDEAHWRALDLQDELHRLLATGRDWDRAINLVDELRVVMAAARTVRDCADTASAQL